MSIPTISFGGVASGLDINAIVSAMVAIRGRRISMLQAKRTDATQGRTEFGTLREKLDALEVAAAKFKKASAFQAFTADSSDDTVLTATADGRAQASVYRIQVLALAAQEIDVASGIADTDTTTMGTGTFTITVAGQVSSITLDSSNNTLAGLVDAINAADAGVSASIVNDGSANPYNLVITADASGTANAVSYDFSGYTAGGVDLSTAIQVNQSAADAQVDVNGITLTRSSNTIDDAITGVSIQLLDQTLGGSDVTLTVSPNADGIVDNLQEFVDAYNEVQNYISGQFAFDQETGVGGPLFGDFTLASVRRRLQSVVGSAISGVDPFNSLASIGIRSTSDGALQIDETELRDAVNQDATAVVKIFLEGAGGIASSLESATQEYTKYGGLLDARDDGFDSTIRDLDGQIKRAQARLDDYETALRLRFAAFESLIGGLQSQSQFLTASLGSG